MHSSSAILFNSATCTIDKYSSVSNSTTAECRRYRDPEKVVLMDQEHHEGVGKDIASATNHLLSGGKCTAIKDKDLSSVCCFNVYEAIAGTHQAFIISQTCMVFIYIFRSSNIPSTQSPVPIPITHISWCLRIRRLFEVSDC